MSVAQPKIKIDLSGLNDLRKALSGKEFVKVGILGADAANIHDSESGLTNSEIGLIQILGSETHNIPSRDFLKMPLEVKKPELMKSLTTPKSRELITQGQVTKVLERLGVKAEGIIQEAFETGGFGRWAANKPSTIRKKGSSKPLIDKSELRRAVSSEVVTGDIV